MNVQFSVIPLLKKLEQPEIIISVKPTTTILSLHCKTRIWLVCGQFPMLLRNERPGRTTLHAWLRHPMSDSSSLWLHAFRSPHSLRRVLSFASLSVGSQSLFAMVSLVIPRNVKHIMGPTVCERQVGLPSASTTASSWTVPGDTVTCLVCPTS